MGKWTDEALRMIPYIRKGAQSLEDAEALEIKTVYPKWDSSETYAAGDKVLYYGVLYKCIMGHTAQKDWSPTKAPSLWTKVLIPDPTIVPEWEQPDSTNGYMKGDRVSHKGKTYESLVDNNVWEPGAVGTETLWAEVET